MTTMLLQAWKSGNMSKEESKRGVGFAQGRALAAHFRPPRSPLIRDPCRFTLHFELIEKERGRGKAIRLLKR